jgi:hypothetical protein
LVLYPSFAKNKRFLVDAKGTLHCLLLIRALLTYLIMLSWHNMDKLDILWLDFLMKIDSHICTRYIDLNREKTYIQALCILDTIQGLCIVLGMKAWINWISRSNLSGRINLVRSTNIIKEVCKVWAYGTIIGHFLNYFGVW